MEISALAGKSCHEQFIIWANCPDTVTLSHWSHQADPLAK